MGSRELQLFLLLNELNLTHLKLGLVGGDIRKPGRNFPRIINTSMTIVLALTLFANVAYFSALSFDDIARSTTIGLVLTLCAEVWGGTADFLQTFSQHFLGRAGSILYAVAICLSTLGTLNVKMFTAGRLTQAAAERRYLPLMMKTVAAASSRKNHDDEETDDEISNPRHTRPMFESLHSPVRLGDGSIPMLVSMQPEKRPILTKPQIRNCLQRLGHLRVRFGRRCQLPGLFDG